MSLLVFLSQSYSARSAHPPLHSLLSCVYSTNANLFRVAVSPEAAAGERSATEPGRGPAAWGGHQQTVQAPSAASTHGHAAYCRYAHTSSSCHQPPERPPFSPPPNPISRLCFPHWSSGSVLQLSLPLSWNYINLKFIDSISNSTAPLPAVSRCSSPPSATFPSCCLLHSLLIQCFAAAAFFFFFCLPPPLVSMYGCVFIHIYIYSCFCVCLCGGSPTGQINNYCQNVKEFTSQNLGKLFMAEALQGQN